MGSEMCIRDRFVLEVLSYDPNVYCFVALPTLIRIANRFPQAEMTKELWDHDYAQTMEECSVLARELVVHMLNPDSWGMGGQFGYYPQIPR